VDPQLLDILVCPLCKGKLLVRRDPAALVCPIRDGIAVMLVDEAQPVSDQELATLKASSISAPI